MELTVDLSELAPLTDEAFFRLCAANRDLCLERTKDGELVVMAPTGGSTGARNSFILFVLAQWNERTRSGIVFDSSTGFRLPNEAVRAPDAAWVAKACWDTLSDAERKAFPPLCPDFVVELMSESDWRAQAEAKEWMANGCRLAWLIHPQEETAAVYRADGTRDTVRSFDATLGGEDVLPGLALPLARLR